MKKSLLLTACGVLLAGLPTAHGAFEASYNFTATAPELFSKGDLHDQNGWVAQPGVKVNTNSKDVRFDSGFKRGIMAGDGFTFKVGDIATIEAKFSLTGNSSTYKSNLHLASLALTEDTGGGTSMPRIGSTMGVTDGGGADSLWFRSTTDYPATTGKAAGPFNNITHTWKVVIKKTATANEFLVEAFLDGVSAGQVTASSSELYNADTAYVRIGALENTAGNYVIFKSVSLSVRP